MALAHLPSQLSLAGSESARNTDPLDRDEFIETVRAWFLAYPTRELLGTVRLVAVHKPVTWFDHCSTSLLLSTNHIVASPMSRGPAIVFHCIRSVGTIFVPQTRRALAQEVVVEPHSPSCQPSPDIVQVNSRISRGERPRRSALEQRELFLSVTNSLRRHFVSGQEGQEDKGSRSKEHSAESMGLTVSQISASSS